MTKTDKGQDFASAAMMRLVVLGLKQQGISVPVSAPNGAHVQRFQKSDVLTGVNALHGPRAILAIADAARSMAPEPVVQALSRAHDIPDLMDRWHRLERFSHGRHTVAVEHLGPAGMRLTHRSLDNGPAPSIAESLLVLGLLAILAEMVGSTEVTLATETGEVWRKNGAWHDPVLPAMLESVIMTPAASSKPDPVKPATDDSTYLSGDPVAELRNIMVADPLRRWTLADLAAEAGASPRTLQRRLGERSASFSRLVCEARVQVAAAHLCKAQGPALAEIGFIAGFADQAHFARTFNRAVGTTPSSYRADFGQ